MERHTRFFVRTCSLGLRKSVTRITVRGRRDSKRRFLFKAFPPKTVGLVQRFPKLSCVPPRTPGQLFDFYNTLGYQLERRTTCGGSVGRYELVLRNDRNER